MAGVLRVLVVVAMFIPFEGRCLRAALLAEYVLGA